MKSIIFSFNILLLFLIMNCSHAKDKLKVVKEALAYEGNQTTKKFNKTAKKKAAKAHENLDKRTFYCHCKYTKSGRNGIPKDSFQECGYKRKEFILRDYQLEWEHVVPAQALGGHTKEWRAKDQNRPKICIEKEITGRDCARESNEKFRLMEADLYNLVPAIGVVNNARLHFDIAMIKGEKRDFGRCDIEIDKINKLVEPPPYVRGDIARIYMYMQASDPEAKIITNKNKEFIHIWNKKDPISKEECERYLAIREIQKNINKYLEKTCAYKQNKLIKKQ